MSHLQKLAGQFLTLISTIDAVYNNTVVLSDVLMM